MEGEEVSMEIESYAIYKEKDVGAIGMLENALKKTGFKKAKTAEEADMLIAIGGDGTFLRAAATFLKSAILPIRYGTHFGTLLHYDIKTARAALESVASGEFSTRKEPLIEAELNGRKHVSAGDFYFQRGREGSAVRYVATIKYSKKTVRVSAVGDGFVVCTPMGSTGYFAYDDRLAGRTPKRIQGFGFAHILPCSIMQKTNGKNSKAALKIEMDGDFAVEAVPTRQLDQLLYSSSFKSAGIPVAKGEKMAFRRSKASATIIE
ncbi:MAG: NAD(+)/NADH kinase [Candidatus Micrarchaeia archaeon]